jgi:hypothetical protein
MSAGTMVKKDIPMAAVVDNGGSNVANTELSKASILSDTLSVRLTRNSLYGLWVSTREGHIY